MSNSLNKKYKWLLPLSFLYGIGVWIRNKCFDWGILKSKSFSIPTICIGNLAVGGTGKTPHTEYLIKLLSKNKFNLAVLSRGYKRKTKGYYLSDENSTAELIGDEPFQMKNKFPNITVAVDEKRCNGISNLLNQSNPPLDLILLDDAFQHRYVKPKVNILLTEYKRLFVDDYLMPAGRLREYSSGKNRAQIVIVTKCPSNLKPMDYRIVKKKLNLFPFQQLYFSTFRYSKLEKVFSKKENGSKRSLSTIKKDTEVILFTGIASPAEITKEISKYTNKITSLTFSDHHDFTKQDFADLKSKVDKIKSDDKIIITTEKDAARLIYSEEIGKTLKDIFYLLPIEVEILKNKQETFNNNILDYVRKN